jgi:predicted nucleotidyltransferase
MPKMKLNSSQIKQIQLYFSQKPVLQVYLFGSYVRGTAHELSDIDLLVVLDYTQPIGLEFVQMQFDLQALLAKKIDLVSARGISKYLQPIIDAEKKLIYARPIGKQIAPATHSGGDSRD